MAGPLIIRLILAGVPAAKLIAKYGKKLYNKAKADIKESDKIDIANKEWIKSSNLLKIGAGVSSALGVLKYMESKSKKKEKETTRPSKDKKFKGHSSYKN